MTTQKALPNDLIDSLLSNYKKPSSISLKYQAASAAAFFICEINCTTASSMLFKN